MFRKRAFWIVADACNAVTDAELGALQAKEALEDAGDAVSLLASMCIRLEQAIRDLEAE